MNFTALRRTINGTIAALLGAAFATAAMGLAPVHAEEAPQSGVQTTWGLSPGSAEGESDGRVSLRHEIDPGTEIADFVILTNYSEQEESFDVYASDGVITADGNFDLIDRAEPPSDAGSWISFGAAENAVEAEGGGLTVTVPAQTSVLIPVTISVPADATPGDHPAGIAAELKSGTDEAVQMMTRVGVRAHLRVNGDIAASMAVESVQTRWNFSWNPFAKGTATVTYTLKNAGNVRSGADLEEEISSVFGWGASASSQEIRELLPKQSVEMVAELKTLPLFFSSGTITAQPTIVGNDAEVATSTPGVAQFRIWTIPWAQIIYLAAGAAIVIVIIQSRKRSAAKVEEKIAAAVAAATQQDDTPETGSPDTGSPETGSPETGSPETGSPETGSPETGSPEPIPAQAKHSHAKHPYDDSSVPEPTPTESSDPDSSKTDSSNPEV